MLLRPVQERGEARAVCDDVMVPRLVIVVIVAAATAAAPGVRG